MKLDHVQLAMPEGGESAARRFYGTMLGMNDVEKPPELRPRGGCWFELKGCHVHLGVDIDFKPATKAHPAFIVSDLAELAMRLEAGGFTITRDVAVPGVERVYTADPFGNRLEFIQAGHSFSDLDEPSGEDHPEANRVRR